MQADGENPRAIAVLLAKPGGHRRKNSGSFVMHGQDCNTRFWFPNTPRS